MDRDLLEKLSVYAARTHILPFLRDFDKSGLHRIEPEQGIRALLSAGLNLSQAEQAQIKAAYTGEDGKFVYDALLSDGSFCQLSCPLKKVWRHRTNRAEPSSLLTSSLQRTRSFPLQ